MLLGQAFSANAEIYKYVDKNGKVHFSDKPFNQSKAKPVDNSSKVAPVAKAPQSKVSQSKVPQPEKPSPVASGYPATIAYKVRTLLDEKSYTELNRFLAQLKRSALNHVQDEDRLWAAYNAFAVAGEGLESKLSAWVSATPGAYQPYLCSGPPVWGIRRLSRYC